MVKSKFNEIMKSLENRINYCSENFGNISCSEDIDNLPICTARKIRDASEKELENMNSVAMVELYHIIGMGNLTAVQMSVFLKKIKEYLSFRPIIKSLSGSLTNMDDIPEINNNTKYRLRVLGNFYIFSGEEDNSVEDIAGTEEYKKKILDKMKGIDLSFTIDNGIIRIKKDQLSNFCNNSEILGCGNGASLSTLLKKIAGNGSYLGIKWESVDDNDVVTGRVVSNVVRNKLNDFQLVNSKQ